MAALVSQKTQKFDLQEFVDLKSHSNYGWRVDLERIRSKYFVDMLRDKNESGGPTNASSTIFQGSAAPDEEAHYVGGRGDKESQLMHHIQMIKHESAKEMGYHHAQPNRRSTLSLIMGGQNKPPLHADHSKQGSDFHRKKINQGKHNSSSEVIGGLKSEVNLISKKRIKQAEISHPVVGQYDPRYSLIRKQSFQNQAFFKADRFLTKEIFPNTWLNNEEIHQMSKSEFIRQKSIKKSTKYNTIDWAKNSDIKIVRREKPELGDDANEFAEVKVIETKDFDKNSSGTGCFRFKRSTSRGIKSCLNSGTTSPSSFIKFDKQLARKSIIEQPISIDPHECRFENYSVFTPTKSHQFNFRDQSERQDFMSPTYISVGGFSYNYGPAVDKFRFSEATLRKALPFVRQTPDYVKVKEQGDMKQLMLKRRREKNHREKMRSQTSYQGDKWVIEGGTQKKK